MPFWRERERDVTATTARYAAIHPPTELNSVAHSPPNAWEDDARKALYSPQTHDTPQNGKFPGLNPRWRIRYSALALTRREGALVVHL